MEYSSSAISDCSDKTSIVEKKLEKRSKVKKFHQDISASSTKPNKSRDVKGMEYSSSAISDCSDKTSIVEKKLEKRSKVKKFHQDISASSTKPNKSRDVKGMEYSSSAISDCSDKTSIVEKKLEKRSKVKKFHQDISASSTKPNKSRDVKRNDIKRTSITKYRIQIYDYNKSNTFRKTLKMITWIVLASAAVLNYMYFNINCIDSFTEASLKPKLSKLYGQDNAVASIIDALTENADESKVLLLFGGTGVGKTYTTDLLFNDHWNNTNVYHYTMPSFKKVFHKRNLNGMLVCKKSVVIVDDLVSNNDVFDQVSDIIKAAESIHNKVTIILIFNCENVYRGFIKRCESSFLEDLKKEFNSLSARKYFIKFNSLTEQILRQCIENEIKALNLKNVDIHALMKNFDVTFDGCKGVHNKIKLLYH